MSDKPCPLCGREMTAIETYPGYGELYCGHCDLVIGGNEAKTPDELTKLLEQRTCHVKAVKKLGDSYGFILSCGHSMVSPFNDYPHYCPWCGAKVVSE